jgi:hypothetical protein
MLWFVRFLENTLQTISCCEHFPFWRMHSGCVFPKPCPRLWNWKYREQECGCWVQSNGWEFRSELSNVFQKWHAFTSECILIPRRERIFFCTKNTSFVRMGLLFVSQQCGCSSPESRCPPTVQTWVFKAKREGAAAWTGGWTQPVTVPPTLLLSSREGFRITPCATINIHSRKGQVSHLPAMFSLALPESRQTV